MNYTSTRIIPTVERDTVTASSRENFKLLEDVLDRYKETGVYAFPSIEVPASSVVSQTHEIEHNLNNRPFFDAFLQAYPDTNGGTITALSDDYVIPYTFGGTIGYESGGSVVVAMTYYIGVDENKMYITRRSRNTTASVQTAPSSKVHYYIQRQNIGD